MMIDSVKVVIPVDFQRPVFGGYVVSTSISHEGEEKQDYAVLKYMACEGSYCSNLQLRCVDGCNLELYGSFTKWLEGHNLFGGSDLFLLLRRVCDKLLLGALRDFPRIKDWQILDAKIQRIDINQMFELRSPEDVKLYLRVAAARTSLSHRGKGALSEDGCTLSWGMHRGNRSAWKVKFYAKGPESRVARKGRSSLLPRLVNDEGVMAWVDRQLRLEYEIHGRELDKLGLRFVRDWNAETASLVWSEKVGLFFWGDEAVDVEENLEIPRRVKNAYAAWLRGDDMTTDCSRATFYRMRSDVKRFYGSDIALPRPDAGLSNVTVMPIRRVLDLQISDSHEIQSRVAELLAA